jgi:hypothetical protein
MAHCTPRRETRKQFPGGNEEIRGGELSQLTESNEQSPGGGNTLPAREIRQYNQLPCFKAALS